VVIVEAALPLDFETTVTDDKTDLDGPRPPVGPGETEAQLVDRQAEILDLIERETQAAGQSGRGDAGKAQKLRCGRDRQSNLVLPRHLRCPTSHISVRQLLIARTHDGQNSLLAGGGYLPGDASTGPIGRAAAGTLLAEKPAVPSVPRPGGP
jgi:hypothetical protein